MADDPLAAFDAPASQTPPAVLAAPTELKADPLAAFDAPPGSQPVVPAPMNAVAEAPSPFSVQGIRNAIASPPGYVSSGILPIAVKEDPNHPGYGDMNAGVKLDWGPVRSVVNPLLDLLEGTGLAWSAGGENSPLAGKVSPAASALLFSTMAGNPNPLQSTASVMRVPFPGPRVAAPGVTRSSILDAALPLVGDEKLRANLTAKQAGQAGAQLGAEATDLPSVRAVLDNPPAPLVPGDNPTTAKLTGDPGIAAAEFTAQRGVGPIPERVTQQQAAAAAQVSAQNDARVAAIKSIEPVGDIGVVPMTLQRQAAASDAATAAQVAGTQTRAAGDISAVSTAGEGRVAREQAAVDAARAQRETESQGRLTTLAETADQARARAEADASGRIGGLQETAEQARARIGGDLPPGSEVQIGAAVRAPVKVFDDTMRAREHAAWEAIDPNGTLAIDMTPVRDGAKQILSDRSPLAEPLAGKEKGIFDTASGLEDVHSFKDLTALRSRLTDAIRQERGNPTGDPQAVRRMSMLLDSVHTAMEGGLTAASGADAASVASGGMSPEQTALSRYAAQRDAWYAEQANANRAQISTVAAGGAGRNAGGGSVGISSVAGGKVSSRSGSGSLAGDQSIPVSTPLTANFDQAAQDRYAAARAATATRKGGFEDAPGVRTILQSGPTAGTFRVPDAMVPAAVIRTGPSGADHVRVYLAKGGTPEALTDAAAFSLRRDAMRPDGTLDPAKAATWADKRSSFLAALPDAAAKFGDAVTAQRNLELAQAAETQAAKVRASTDATTLKSATTAEAQAMKVASAAEAARLKAVTTEAAQTLKAVTAIAQRTVDDAVAQRAAGIKERQASAVGKFLGEGDPVATLWSVLNDKTMGAAKARQLKAAIGGDAAAEAGMRRMVGETIEKNLVGVPKGVTSEEGGVAANRFQNFMKFSEPALAELLGPEDLAKLKATNEMMIRDFRSAKVGTDSATGQLTASRGFVGKLGETIFRNVGAGSIGGAIGNWIGGQFGFPGAGATLGVGVGLQVANVIQSAREAGIQNVADLKAAAYLNPALFRVLATEVTPKNRGAILGALNTTLRRSSLIGAMQGQRSDRSGPPNNAMLY